MTDFDKPHVPGHPRHLPTEECLDQLRLNPDAGKPNVTLPRIQTPYRKLESAGLLILGGSAERPACYSTRVHVHEPSQVTVVSLSNSCHGVCAVAVRIPPGLEEIEGRILDHSLFEGSRTFGVVEEITRYHGQLTWHSVPNVAEHEFDAKMAEHLKTIYCPSQEGR